jgi:hypothetical protein
MTENVEKETRVVKRKYLFHIFVIHLAAALTAGTAQPQSMSQWTVQCSGQV